LTGNVTETGINSGSTKSEDHIREVEVCGEQATTVIDGKVGIVEVPDSDFVCTNLLGPGQNQKYKPEHQRKPTRLIEM
jgi:hypothetical protein